MLIVRIGRLLGVGLLAFCLLFLALGVTTTAGYHLMPGGLSFAIETERDVLFALGLVFWWVGSLVGGWRLIRNVKPSWRFSLMALAGYLWVMTGLFINWEGDFRLPWPTPEAVQDSVLRFLFLLHLLYGAALCAAFDLLLTPWRKPLE